MGFPDDPQPPTAPAEVADGREFFRAGPGDVRTLLQHLGVRQQDFEKYLARQLGTDEVGLEALHHLISVGAATPTVLAHSVGISTAAMTLVLGRLEAAGHVGRAPHPSDRRKVVVTVTPASGERAAALVAPFIGGLDQLVADLTDPDRAVVAHFLRRVLELYQAVTPAP